MRGPKHLWAGDWENESASASPPRPLPPQRQEPEQPPAPETPSERRRRRLRRPSRTALLATVAVLLLAGGAYGLTTLHGANASPAVTQQAWLGVRLVSWQGGVLVAGVVPGSPAQSAGLRAGDVITEVQDRPVVAPVNVSGAVQALMPGDTVQLRFERHGQMYSTATTVAARPSGTSYS